MLYGSKSVRSRILRRKVANPHKLAGAVVGPLVLWPFPSLLTHRGQKPRIRALIFHNHFQSALLLQQPPESLDGIRVLEIQPDPLSPRKRNLFARDDG